MKRKYSATLFAAVAALTLAGCGTVTQNAGTTVTPAAAEADAQTPAADAQATAADTQTTAPDTQTPVSDETLVMQDATDYTIEAAGTYTVTGSAKNATVIVDAADTDTVEIVLDSVTVTNDDFPCIYVKNADKVLVTSTDSKNSLSVTGTFRQDGSTNTDAVIFSRDDLVLDGAGSLEIASAGNGISGKDDLAINGGTLFVTSAADAVEANNSITVAGGEITIASEKDGLHAEDNDDNTRGEIIVSGGTLDITAADDGIQGTTTVRIDDGSIRIAAAEGIEGTLVELNGGTLDIEASDDGINASVKSAVATPAVTVNGGTITIVMGAGDTDAIDSNGDLYIRGGTINITAVSAFDYTGTGEMTDGDVTVNGTAVTSLGNQMRGNRMTGGTGGFGGSGTVPDGTGVVEDPGMAPDGTGVVDDPGMAPDGFRGGNGTGRGRGRGPKGGF